MYKFKFNITKEDIDAHVKNSILEEKREKFKNITFVPFNVRCNEDMDIEIIAVGALNASGEEVEN